MGEMNGYEPPTEEGEQMVVLPIATFHQLMKDSYELGCLHQGGVDDWEWYEQCLEDGGFYAEYDN